MPLQPGVVEKPGHSPHVSNLHAQDPPALAWLVRDPRICCSVLLRLQATPSSSKASVSPSEPEFDDFWKFHLTSLIPPPPTPK